MKFALTLVTLSVLLNELVAEEVKESRYIDENGNHMFAIYFKYINFCSKLS